MEEQRVETRGADMERLEDRDEWDRVFTEKLEQGEQRGEERSREKKSQGEATVRGGRG